VKSIKIRSFPRLHFSLIDLARNGFRKYGGIGMCINALPIDLTFEASTRSDLSLLIHGGYLADETLKLKNRLDKAQLKLNLPFGVKLIDCKGIQRHLGLGAGTRVALSCIEALLNANNIYAEEELIKEHSGRGGASRVGLHSYFHGGLSLDIGRIRNHDGFKSSDIQDGEFPLPITVCSNNTLKWPIVLVIPKLAIPISIERENEFFNATTPLDDQTVHEAAYTALFGIFGSAASEDYKTFCDAINHMQSLAWKKAETAIHGENFVSQVRHIYEKFGAASIVSSLGPTIACFSNDHEKLIKQLEIALPDSNLITTYPRNEGREILYA
jgi:beta-ribofuranosylaminobenzene 5'-phosphate synthase